MEPLQKESTLTIPNDLFYLPAIQAFVAGVGEKMGFEKRDMTMLQIALEEAIVNVIRHAFEPDENTTYQVIVHAMTSGIRVIIKDKGLPYSPSLVPEYTPPTDIEDAAGQGLGSHLIKKSVDEIFFHNLGRDGKELHLVKYLPYRSVQEINAPSELERFPEPIKLTTSPEKKAFTVRLIRPSEVYDVSKLFYRAYGYSYGIDTIYYPEKLADRHADGTIISMVTVSEDNRIVGHAALVRDERGSKTAEAAMAVVEPSYRGQGCQSVMIGRLVEEARNVGLVGIFSKAVTNHIYAQKAGQKAGFKRCALVAGLIPADRTFKGIHATLSQRESVAYGYRTVDDPGNITIFPPAKHRDIIQKIYNAIGVRRFLTDQPFDLNELQDEDSEVNVTVVPGYNRAIMEVKKYGKQTVQHVHAILKELCYQKIEQITLYLNLEHPAILKLIDSFEYLGFFFAGILPFSHVGDALLLQYLNNVPIDYGKINIAGEMGEEILAYVRQSAVNTR